MFKKRPNTTDQYEVKMLRRYTQVKRHLAQGWEVTSTSGQMSMFDHRVWVRRPNPHYVAPKENAGA